MKLVTCYPLTPENASRIKDAVPDWDLVQADQDSVAGLVGDADVFCGHARHRQIDWESVVQAGRLKWIQSSAAGLDHCLVPAIIESSVAISGCEGLFRNPVAEQTMALLYGLFRSIPEFVRAQDNKEFVRRPTEDLHGKTIGIAGFGGNGQRIAELLLPLGNELIATERFVDEWKAAVRLPGIREILPAEELDELLRRSDVVILTLPLNESTECIIGERELALMPGDSWLINVGRGRLVDERALADALGSGHLRGAGLDVTFVEPLPPESPLWTEPDVLISPHVGAQSAVRYDLVTELLVRNLGCFLRGEAPRNLVDKQVGFSLPADRA